MSEAMIHIGRREEKISAESLTRDLIKEIEKISESTKDGTRLNRFVQQYNKFKKQEFTDRHEVVQPFILGMMKGPLTLYALTMNGQVLVDLVAILGEYAIAHITELFRPDLARYKLVTDLIERRHLADLAKYLVTLGVWKEKDAIEAGTLNTARNAIVHKDVKKFSKVFNKGVSVFKFEIDRFMSREEVLPYIMMTIRLLFKLMIRK